MDDYIKAQGYKSVKAEDKFLFQCKMCGDCCRNVKDAIMLESLDLFRIARFLEKDIADVVQEYTTTGVITWGYPVLLMKVKQHMDA